jgi:hypothetical protein
MPYYAKVELGSVTEVILAEQLFIDEMPKTDTWVQTSIDTRGGVHYSADGKPDGGSAIRKNFARVGYIYDAERDAFYLPNKNPRLYLDEATCLWVPYIKSTLFDSPSAYVASDTNRKTLYVPQNTMQLLNKNTLDGLQHNLGIDITTDISLAGYVLLLSDTDVYEMLAYPSTGVSVPFTAGVLLSLTDRIDMKSLGFDSLPVTIPLKKEDVLGLPNTPIFVKRRRTYSKEDNGIAYSTWESPSAFVDSMHSSFWEEQAKPNPLYGEYVIQPALSYPIKSLHIHIAVNCESEALIWSVDEHRLPSVNQFGRVTPYTGDISELATLLQGVCTKYGLRNGLHSVQFVWYDNKWTLLDWNARGAANSHVRFFAAVHPVLDQAIAHMMDIPKPKKQQTYYEARGYHATPIPAIYVVDLYAAQLFPRRFNSTGDVVQVAGIGLTKTEVQARFNYIENGG